MADIAWTGYALAMFTPEQRAAAAAGEEWVPGETTGVLPPTPIAPRIEIVGGFLIDGLNPNIPEQLAQLYERGWTFRSGQWVKLGTGVVPPGDPPGRIGLSSVIPVSTSLAGSVLGYNIPAAAPVLLPSFVGGRLGRVEIAGGMRPESGGQERVIIGGLAGAARMPEVRF